MPTFQSRNQSRSANGTASLGGTIGSTIFGLFFAGFILFITGSSLFGSEKVNDGWWVVASVTSLFVLIGLAFPFFSWRSYLRQRRGVISSISSQSSNAGNKLGVLGFIGFFSIFLISGVLATYFTFVKPTLGWWSAQSWKPVPCVVVSSKVHRSYNDNSTTYTPRMTYRYRVAGKQYTSKRYSFASGDSSDRAGAYAAVRKYHAGKHATCYVDPNDPTQAVIERHFTGRMWFGLIPIVFVFIGAGGIIGTLTLGRTRKARGDEASWLHTSAKETTLANEPITFTSGSARIRSLTTIVIFTLIWNGFIGPFAYFVFTNGAPLFAKVIIGIFLLVGLGSLFGAVPYQLLAMMNPKVRVTLNKRLLHLGDVIEVNWNVYGNTARLKDFHIALQAREEASHGAGSNRTTDRHTITEIPIFKSNDPAGMAMTSSVQITIPTNVMHTFEASNNKILWHVVVSGDIPKWPDVKDEYPIRILPLPAASSSTVNRNEETLA